MRWISTATAAGIALAASVAGCARPATRAGSPELIIHPMGGRPDLPFSEAAQVGSVLYLAGQIGDSGGRLVDGGIGPETEQALRNIRAVLERHGSSMDRVFKCTAMLADMREWAAMNAVYVKHFRRLPARSAFGTSGLVMGSRIELECMAAVGPGPGIAR